MNRENTDKIRKLTMTAMLAAIASVLMFISFSVPLMPGFVKIDFSELPALIASFTLGPLSGVTVCFIKNVVHLLGTDTGGVGELSNFILGASFVLPAGLIYRKTQSRMGALAGSLLGAAAMAVISLFSNYYLVYPIYANIMPMEVILGAYQTINPHVKNLWQALMWFNMPFTFIKGLFSVLVTVLVYQKLTPIIRGTGQSMS